VLFLWPSLLALAVFFGALDFDALTFGVLAFGGLAADGATDFCTVVMSAAVAAVGKLIDGNSFAFVGAL
jgi:hypothetical protein